MSYVATPGIQYNKCVCATCGPPWRYATPEPIKAQDFSGWLSWHSWMALCPTCGNKRCPGAADHRNICTASNAPGQQKSLYPAHEPDSDTSDGSTR